MDSLYSTLIDLAEALGSVPDEPTGDAFFGVDQGFVYQAAMAAPEITPEGIKVHLDGIFDEAGSESRVSQEEAALIFDILNNATESMDEPGAEYFEINSAENLQSFLDQFFGIGQNDTGVATPSMPSDSANAGQTEQAKSGMFASVNTASVQVSDSTPIVLGGSTPAANTAPSIVEHSVVTLKGNLESDKSRIINFKFMLKDDSGEEQRVDARFVIPAGVKAQFLTGTIFTDPLSQWSQQKKEMHTANAALALNAEKNGGSFPQMYSDGQKLDAYFVQQALGYGDSQLKQEHTFAENVEKPKSATRINIPTPMPPNAAVKPAPTSGKKSNNKGAVVVNSDGWPSPPSGIPQEALAKVQVLNTSSIQNRSVEFVKVWQHKNGLRLVATGKVGTVNVSYYLPPYDQNLLARMNMGGTQGQDVLVRSRKEVATLANTRNLTLDKTNDQYQKISNATQKTVANNIFEFLRTPDGMKLLGGQGFGYEGPMVQVSQMSSAPAGDFKMNSSVIAQLSGDRAPAPVANAQQPNANFSMGGNSMPATNSFTGFNASGFGNVVSTQPQQPAANPNANVFQMGAQTLQPAQGQQQVPVPAPQGATVQQQQQPNPSFSFAQGQQQPTGQNLVPQQPQQNQQFTMPAQASNPQGFNQVQNAIGNAQGQQQVPAAVPQANANPFQAPSGQGIMNVPGQQQQNQGQVSSVQDQGSAFGQGFSSFNM